MEVSWFAEASFPACVTCAVAETKHRADNRWRKAPKAKLDKFLTYTPPQL